jgi:hypothetical protein
MFRQSSTVVLVGLVSTLFGCSKAIPGLRPAVQLPLGYTWVLGNGSDFYCWTGDKQANGKDAKDSGLTMCFGHFPRDLKKAETEEAGVVASIPVTWHITRNADQGLRYETIVEYVHAPGFDRIMLHVWVWGKTEKELRPLLKVMEGMLFAEYDVNSQTGGLDP